jgi:hypothetical protein
LRPRLNLELFLRLRFRVLVPVDVSANVGSNRASSELAPTGWSYRCAAAQYHGPLVRTCRSAFPKKKREGANGPLVFGAESRVESLNETSERHHVEDFATKRQGRRGRFIGGV